MRGRPGGRCGVVRTEAHGGRNLHGGVDGKDVPAALHDCRHLPAGRVADGSRMDEVIFQEFKGTGNMELVLDRQLANRRIWPAIDISQSGTRKEELLIDRATLDKIGRLRRHLDTMQAGQDTEMLIRAMKKHPTNEKFLAELP